MCGQLVTTTDKTISGSCEEAILFSLLSFLLRIPVILTVVFPLLLVFNYLTILWVTVSLMYVSLESSVAESTELVEEEGFVRRLKWQNNSKVLFLASFWNRETGPDPLHCSLFSFPLIVGLLIRYN